MEIRNVCVFCGSNMGNDPIFAQKAEELALLLAERHINLVYGAGDRGLMGKIALMMKNHGSQVIGISPKRFAKHNEHSFPLDEYVEVDTMHQRKELMYEKSDAFLALPGGCGTLEELAEIFTWRQLGYHGKPVVLYNISHFYDHLVAQMNSMVVQGFMQPAQMAMMHISEDAEDIMAYLEAFVREQGKWEK